MLLRVVFLFLSLSFSSSNIPLHFSEVTRQPFTRLVLNQIKLCLNQRLKFSFHLEKASCVIPLEVNAQAAKAKQESTEHIQLSPPPN